MNKCSQKNKMLIPNKHMKRRSASLAFRERQIKNEIPFLPIKLPKMKHIDNV